MGRACWSEARKDKEREYFAKQISESYANS